MKYSNMTRKKLISLCKEKGVKGYSGKKKEELVNMLSKKDISPVSSPTNEVDTDVSIQTNEKVNSEKKEVQAHGLFWEKEILKNVYGVTPEKMKNIKYTSKMDLPSELNQLDYCDLSVKTTCNVNTVCMADCLRLYDAVSSETPFHLVVICYEQNDNTNTKKIKCIVEIDLTNSHKLLFGTLTRSQIEELDKAVKSIPQKRKPTDEEHKKIYSIRNRLQEHSGAIYLNIKCNSTQSRLQCSFNHFMYFIKKNASRVIEMSKTNEFRGGIISLEINSSRRIFKKKQNV